MHCVSRSSGRAWSSMNADRIQQALDNLGNALARLKEALALATDEAVRRDVVILRFVLVYETSWTALKRCLASEQIDVRYPKDAFRQAYRVGWLEHETPWINMLGDRNLIAHTYNEATAIRVYEDIKRYLPEFHQLYQYLSDRFGRRA
jgi:nucleotidyltransferase substrate binding protein (TIGR01987 family)